MKKFAASLGTVLVMLGAAPAQAAEGVTARTILIGQNITLEGGKNEYGQAALAGMQTYLNLVNARGGVNGRQVVLKTLDDDNKGAKAEANARQLVEHDKVFALFGSIEGGPSTAVMKVANELKVPFFGPMAGSPTIRRPFQPLVFPVRAEHREEFRALIGHARSIGMKKVAFLRADSEIGELHLANVRLICKELGMELVADLPFKADTTDAQYQKMVDQLAPTGAHMMLNHGSSGVYEKVIRMTRAQGLRTAFYGVNSGSTQMVKRMGELSHGMIFAQVVPSPWERKTSITREYQEEFARFKPGQDFSYGSLEGYMTAKALVAALKLAGPNPTRESFAGALQVATLDINGLPAVYDKTNRQGLAFVDLAVVTRESKFRH
ncbi:ABC transporter substrate-binding protein [Polaromonas sp.]|jgi:ABC-type branched-subunit amino acid transport system substrate-binding protein|uniref:ABC transporter substrate-binding protein n=1 Tax=Polaromonas sp. TaxID=1869339 RepID=UPI002CBA8F24|nr:ABC transporter substrate-binding protein [Polaromonas sp.]HQS33147.1 ABC transporter substrate-binding protein [Polaromonas sp.]HQS92402.1 ABC transporter substrate-binding protein [Polaromonas sp.]